MCVYEEVGVFCIDCTDLFFSFLFVCVCVCMCVKALGEGRRERGRGVLVRFVGFLDFWEGEVD